MDELIGGLKVLAIIPARGGSKGLPGKNIIDLCGKPLIAWTIEAARHSRYLDRTILSSDDQEIIAVSSDYKCGVPFVRPPELASDTASSLDVVRHAVRCVAGYDLVVLLQPTSPLRTAADIDSALEQLVQTNAQGTVSVCRVSEHPHWMFMRDEHNHLKKFVQKVSAHRRQELPELFIPNGAIYIVRADMIEVSTSLILDDALAFEMDTLASIDIDNEIDLQIAKSLMPRRWPEILMGSHI